MAFITKTDLETHIYAELITEITRGNDTNIDKAIGSAISEAKMYLSRYNLLALFGNATTDPTVVDEYLEHLRHLVTDIACWHLVKLSNPNIDLKLFRTLYEDAIKTLEKIMKGQATPEGWPYKADDPATESYNENASVQYSSNPKRTQHF
ncbi:MAG: DUF1320 family protein [Cyclobacteriaceae bacterium]|nr:DUF1320 family protein [Cyclobacteriaceae bacterium]